MKHKLLFVQDSLRLAGSEKSMIALLQNLDPDLYEIDVQLMSYGGELEKEIPRYINLLPSFEYIQFNSKGFFKTLLSIRKFQHLRFITERIKYSMLLRKGMSNHLEKAQFFWESVGKVISPSVKKYDVAIAFAQGFPTFYVADKINAQNKICWVNALMYFMGDNKKFQEKYYKKFDKIVCISDKTKDYMQNGIPSVSTKLTVLPNIIDFQEIFKAAAEKKVIFSDKEFNILTVGRLNNKSKGMDIAINACKLLKDKTLAFHWYFLGEGYYRAEMEEIIKEQQLQECVTLVGSNSNPYPYFKAANLYVQTSRNEGFGRTIAEARMLNLPLVTTNFDGVDLQISNEKNGLVTDINAEAVAAGIERMMNDKGLYQSVVENLKQEKKENTESIEKFDSMIRELLDAK